ncbi:ORF037 [Staphylococcus phage EW]|uniref:ORF037 n=1 Tax=Staphylococcus phage EW TaxID=2936814 RepID=Q4ZC09_9CAUD|nr:ORF037 [Staphylococcus phage EW]AAX91375.1 ORF037 [Staphylococcus phage EW]
MVKIKTKREMTLPELIQWSWDNGEEHRIFYGSKDGEVCFNDDSWVTIETAVEPDETFTFEVEEEITEDTVINGLVEVYRSYSGFLKSVMFPRESVRVAKRDVTVAFYMLNDDYTMTLIWRNGEMVE